MKKRIVLLLILPLALTSVVGVAQAKSAHDLAALADYFPSDAPFFAAIRTDDAFFEELDSVFARVNANLGSMLPLPPGFTLSDIINQQITAGTGLSFDRLIGDWLGDTVAVSIPTLEGLATGEFERSPAVLAAAQVTDSAAANQILALVLSSQGIEPAQGDGYTLYDAGGQFGILIADDVLLVGVPTDRVLTAFAGYEETLADNETFQSTLDLLPFEEGYDALLYMDAGAVIDAIMTVTRETMAMQGMDETFPMMDMMMAQMPGGFTEAVGLAISDGRVLLADVAVLLAESSPMAMYTMAEQNPVDLAFAQYVPASAALVVLDNDFGADMLAAFDMLDQFDPMLQQLIDTMRSILMEQLRSEGGLDELGRGGRLIQRLIEGFDISVLNFGGMTKNAITPIFAGLTGLNLEDDVLGWMNGDYASYLGAIVPDSGLPMSIYLGFVTEATDAEKAAYIVERLTEVAGLYDQPFTTEEIGGGNALALTEFVPSFFPPDMSDVAMNTPELHLMIGANDEVLAMGVRPGVEFALGQDGASLLDTLAFKYAAEKLILDDASTVMYIGTAGLLDAMADYMRNPAPGVDELQMAAFAIAQVESITFSAAQRGDNAGLMRVTLTIPKEVTTGS